MDVSSELAGRWRTSVVLKRDHFSTVERGRYLAQDGEVDAVLRRIDEVPWWARPIARHFLAREREALAAAEKLGITVPLLQAGRGFLVRGWIDGAALHIAKPAGDHRYFHSAKTALRKLHRAGITHNDLAKEQNWLRGADGRAYLTDFQLATRFRHRGRLFRTAAYEDLRHLLKQKRRYLPDALTAAERRVLARKSLIARAWLATVRRAYLLIVRRLLGYADREGGGVRLIHDAPRIAARLKAHPDVREVAIVAFPNVGTGTGLYAFVEGGADLSEHLLRDFIAGMEKAPKLPEHLQVTPALPRRANGDVRSEILQLVALNQVDQIDPLIASDADRAAVADIIANRRNLADRHHL
jgi:predicted Ser/Thr protein kinase